MKIVQVIPYFCYGGAEIMCESLTYALTAQGHDVCVVSLYGEKTPIARRMEAAGVRIRYLDKKLGLDLSMVPKLSAIFREERPDAVHTHLNCVKYAVAAARLAGVKKCVHTVHNVADKEAEGLLQKLMNGAYFRLGWAVPVALSPKVHKSICNFYGLKPEKVPTVYNGADLGSSVPKDSYVLGSPAVILHIGRFNEQKNHRGLLDAFRLVLQTHPQTQLRLLGDGELKEQTAAYAQALGIADHVEFCGSQSDVWPYLRQADIFVLPSKYEGMPMTLIEAMAAGLPIAASGVGGVPDMLTDGESGLLVDGSPEAAAAACTRLLEDASLRERLGRAARAESRRFSSQEMARAYARLYEGTSEQFGFG